MKNYDINTLTSHGVIHGFVRGSNRAGEWIEVKIMSGDPGGFVLKAQLIDDDKSKSIINTLRSLLEDRIIVQRLKQCPSDLLSVQWAVGLDEVSSGTADVYASSAGCTAGGSR